MDELEKLEHLSCVSKVCTELDNHLGLNDKDVAGACVLRERLPSDSAEFVVHLVEENPTFDSFKKALIAQDLGDQFEDSFISNLLRLIQRMKPPKKRRPRAESPGPFRYSFQSSESSW